MNFRPYHLQNLLQQWQEALLPLDVLMKRYFKLHKAIGSKDRAWISDTLYHYVRWKNVYDHLQLLPYDPLPILDKNRLSKSLYLACPEKLLSLLEASYTQEQIEAFCQINQTRAPVTLRANPLKTTRNEVIIQLQNYGYEAYPTHQSMHGITLASKANFSQMPEFQAGLFEVQDEASQLGADLVQLKPKEKVLDFCAGSGGKTLAFAHRLQKTGQLYLHDIRPYALTEAKLRLKRAGIQNAQFNLPQKTRSMDWVVVDAPCSGTGTYRRNPDLKWKFATLDLPKLIDEQRKIFDAALCYLAPHGTIVYMTCSILEEENEKQLNYFQEKHGLEVIHSFKTLPISGGMDGFFAVSLKKTAIF